jgi:protein-L-isoaspartate O-methyltransferase
VGEGTTMTDERFFDKLYEIDVSADVKGHYARFASTYDDELIRHGYEQPQRVAEMLVSLKVEHDARVLDAGCGSGLSGGILVIAVNDGVYPDGPIKERLDELARTGLLTPHDAHHGEHIRDLPRKGWVLTARRLR